MLKHMLASGGSSLPPPTRANGGPPPPPPPSSNSNGSHPPPQLNGTVVSLLDTPPQVLSQHDTSKHSLAGTTSTSTGLTPNACKVPTIVGLESVVNQNGPQYLRPIPNGDIGHHRPMANGGLHLSRTGPALTQTPHSPQAGHGAMNTATGTLSRFLLLPRNAVAGVVNGAGGTAGEMLASLALLCVLALLLALVSLVFLLKIPSVAEWGSELPHHTDKNKHLVTGAISLEEYQVVYEVTLGLCVVTMSLNLCCLLVCAIQFLFVVRLVRDENASSNGVATVANVNGHCRDAEMERDAVQRNNAERLHNEGRTRKFLRKSSATRACAVCGFFISIPVFLTGVVLYTLFKFSSTPAIVTSACIGFGIIFCGCALVHNVFVWQKERSRWSSSSSSSSSAPPPPPPVSVPTTPHYHRNTHISAPQQLHPHTILHHKLYPPPLLQHHIPQQLQQQQQAASANYIVPSSPRVPSSPVTTAEAGETTPTTPLPVATLDLSTATSSHAHELSTLV